MDNRESLHYGYQPINTEVILIGHEKSREEGEKQAKIAVAREMLTDKMDINTIAKFTGLSTDEIKNLQK